MSTYEDYNTTSRSYEDSRRPIGADVVAAMVQLHSAKQLKDIHLLDAGCGTGNYSKALIGYGIGKLTLMDASPGMLNQAKTKLADDVKNKFVVDIIEDKLPLLPFVDKSFDAILFSLVLHHLKPGDVDDETKRFQDLQLAIKEARRVLKPDGVLIVIAASPDDLCNNWYYHINKDITNRYIQKYASLPKYLEIFEGSGFDCVQKLRLLGTVFTSYLNPEGPLDKAWRDCDSYWAVASEEELIAVKQKLYMLKEKGELEDFVRRHDRVNTHGIVTMFVCK